jgi:hypothetical protein
MNYGKGHAISIPAANRRCLSFGLGSITYLKIVNTKTKV